MRLSLIFLCALCAPCLGLAEAPEPASAPVVAATQAYDVFLGEVKRVVEGHQWLAFLDLCHPKHKEAQLGTMGMGAAHYIAEQMGLGYADNSLEGKGPTTAADLNRIKSITIKEKKQAGEWLEVKGEITLDSGKVLRLELSVMQDEGKLYLTGGVG